MADDRHVLGSEGERCAEAYLRAQRYTIVARNYRCPLGELDLIALDRGTVVFVEVKTRARPGRGTPFEAVDGRKQRQLLRVAQHYLVTHRLTDRDARFDVVGVWWDDGTARCELLRNAFEVA